MLTRQGAALRRQREREEQEWRERVARLRQEEEQARLWPRRDGRYVVVHAPSMSDPVPPPEEDIFYRQRLEASYEFPDQDVATSGDRWRRTIPRMLGQRHGPRTPRFRRENFHTLVPVVVAAPRPRRRRYMSVNAIMQGQAVDQDAQGAAGSDDGSQGSEEHQAEEIAEGVAQGCQEEFVLKGAEDHGWRQDEAAFKGAQDHGWEEEEEVGWQVMQEAQDQDAGLHQVAEDYYRSLEGFNPDVFFKLSYDEGEE